MSMSPLLRRVIALAFALPLLALATAATEPPRIELPAGSERSFTVTSSSLTIQVSRTMSYLRFENGATVSAEDFELRADSVELDIDSSGLASQQLELPEVTAEPERVAQDPGTVAAEMARELKMPRATFDSSVLKRIGAAGGVSVSARGVKLTTGEIVSTDGGESWSTSGGSLLTREDSASGEKYSLSAASIAYNRVSEQALAQGDVTASYLKPGMEPIVLEAERSELDLKAEQLTVSGGISTSFGKLTLSCSTLTADLKKQLLHANGGAVLTDSEHGLKLSATALDLALQENVASASGGVSVEHEGYRASLTAERIEVDIDSYELLAKGSPSIRYGNSSFAGEQIRVLLDGDRTIVEVDGEQTARIDVKELESLQPGQALPGS